MTLVVNVSKIMILGWCDTISNIIGFWIWQLITFPLRGKWLWNALYWNTSLCDLYNNNIMQWRLSRGSTGQVNTLLSLIVTHMYKNEPSHHLKKKSIALLYGFMFISRTSDNNVKSWLLVDYNYRHLGAGSTVNI